MTRKPSDSEESLPNTPSAFPARVGYESYDTCLHRQIAYSVVNVRSRCLIADGGRTRDWNIVAFYSTIKNFSSYVSTSFLFRLMPLLTRTSIKCTLFQVLTMVNSVISYLRLRHNIKTSILSQTMFCSVNSGKHSDMRSLIAHTQLT